MSKIDNGGYVYPDTSPKSLPNLHRGITRRDALADSFAVAQYGALQIAVMIASIMGADAKILKDENLLTSLNNIPSGAYEMADLQIAEGRKGE